MPSKGSGETIKISDWCLERRVLCSPKLLIVKVLWSPFGSVNATSGDSVWVSSMASNEWFKSMKRKRNTFFMQRDSSRNLQRKNRWVRLWTFWNWMALHLGGRNWRFLRMQDTRQPVRSSAMRINAGLDYKCPPKTEHSNASTAPPPWRQMKKPQPSQPHFHPGEDKEVTGE